MIDKKILICDDDEGILDMLEIVLESSGYTVLSVKNSLTIFDIINKNVPDLLLLDLWMPVLSGDQILKTLRTNNDTRALPVIVFSASTDGQQIATDAGATDFISKPFNVDQLIDKVQRLTN